MTMIAVTIQVLISCGNDAGTARQIIHDNAIACLQNNEEGLVAGLEDAEVYDYEIETTEELGVADQTPVPH